MDAGLYLIDAMQLSSAPDQHEKNSKIKEATLLLQLQTRQMLTARVVHRVMLPGALYNSEARWHRALPVLVVPEAPDMTVPQHNARMVATHRHVHDWAEALRHRARVVVASNHLRYGAKVVRHRALAEPVIAKAP